MNQFLTSISKKQAIIAGIIVIVLAGISWSVFIQPTPVIAPETGSEQASTTETGTQPVVVGTTPAKKTLPPETPFVLPEGAVAVDEYAYTQDDVVYFRSLTGKNALAIPDAKADSFKRLAAFMTYPGTAVVSDCGAAPLYTYYGDEKRTYFYQIWRAPEFRSSQVEVIIGANPKKFEINGTTATDAESSFSVSYQKTASSTCALVLNKID